MIEYTIIRSKRRSIGIEVRPDSTVVVRAPIGFPKRKVDAFVIEKEEWIRKAQEKQKLRKAVSDANVDGSEKAVKTYSPKELNALKSKTKATLVPMTADIAREMGVTYGNITIRAQKTRWGSCSSKGNINYNCLLALLPENIQRYVVVHELCHRKEMNHSHAFWNEVARYQPTYVQDRKQLRYEGRMLMERLR